jgi:hypothetical protein
VRGQNVGAFFICGIYRGIHPGKPIHPVDNEIYLFRRRAKTAAGFKACADMIPDSVLAMAVVFAKVKAGCTWGFFPRIFFQLCKCL